MWACSVILYSIIEFSIPQCVNKPDIEWLAV